MPDYGYGSDDEYEEAILEAESAIIKALSTANNEKAKAILRNELTTILMLRYTNWPAEELMEGYDD